MPFAAYPSMQLCSTNYLTALLACLSAKLSIAIATAQKLRFALAPINTLTMVISPSFYWDYKAVFCKVYDLYFAKALIHGFTRVMKPSFYYDSKAIFCKVYDPLLC